MTPLRTIEREVERAIAAREAGDGEEFTRKRGEIIDLVAWLGNEQRDEGMRLLDRLMDGDDVTKGPQRT